MSQLGNRVAALAALDDGALFGSPARMRPTRMAMALHCAQHPARSVHYRMFTQVHAASRTLWLTTWAAETDATFVDCGLNMRYPWNGDVTLMRGVMTRRLPCRAAPDL